MANPKLTQYRNRLQRNGLYFQRFGAPNCYPRITEVVQGDSRGYVEGHFIKTIDEVDCGNGDVYRNNEDFHRLQMEENISNRWRIVTMTSEENDAIMKERRRARKRKVNMTDEQNDAHRAIE